MGGNGFPVNDIFEYTITNFEINGYKYFIWKATIYDSDLYVNAVKIRGLLDKQLTNLKYISLKSFEPSEKMFICRWIIKNIRNKIKLITNTLNISNAQIW